MSEDIPLPAEHLRCHETGFKKRCRDLCRGCWKYMRVPVKDSDDPMVTTYRWVCADQATAGMLYQLLGETNGAGRAIESLRNEVAKGTEKQFARVRLLENNDGSIKRLIDAS